MSLVMAVPSREYKRIENKDFGINIYIRGLTASEMTEAQLSEYGNFNMVTDENKKWDVTVKGGKKFTGADRMIFTALKKTIDGDEPGWNLTSDGTKIMEITLENVSNLFDNIHTWIYKEVKKLSVLEVEEIKN